MDEGDSGETKVHDNCKNKSTKLKTQNERFQGNGVTFFETTLDTQSRQLFRRAALNPRKPVRPTMDSSVPDASISPKTTGT